MELFADPVVMLVRAGLDMASMRQQVNAHNIANANSPGFMATRVSFDSHLQRLRTATLDGSAEELLAATLDRSVVTQETGAPVALDQEMADMSQNVLQYQTLSKLLRRHFDLLSMATSDGRK